MECEIVRSIVIATGFIIGSVVAHYAFIPCTKSVKSKEEVKCTFYKIESLCVLVGRTRFIR